MNQPTFKYDEISDTFYISFSPGEAATGIELNENILLRIDKAEARAIGITLFNYSILAQETETGLRSFPMPGLDELAPETRQIVLAILHHPPVSDFLAFSTYTPGFSAGIPIAALKSPSLRTAA